MLLTSAAVSRACGPDFPNSYLALSDDAILALPEGFFARELAALPPPAGNLPHAALVSEDGQKATNTQDVAEVRLALESLKLPAGRAKDIGDAYQKARFYFLPAPEGLPEEFALYYAGVLAWHKGWLDDARSAWKGVLALPEAKRRHRSIWAAYMLGRLEPRLPGQNPATVFEKASAWFSQTRALAAQGFADPLGLAAASYGWEAQAAVATGDYVKGFHLYRLQLATGDTASATTSLRWTAKRVVEMDDRTLATVAGDELSRRLLTAYFLSFGSLDDFDTEYQRLMVSKAAHWATILGDAGLHDLPDTDRLAWLAYEGGLFTLSEKWAALASADSPQAEWIRAKLALRKGDLPAGEDRLRRALALPGLAEEHRPRLFAELGRVCLSENKVVPALDAWMGGGHWQDAAYLAEHVLTLDELGTYVNARCPSGTRLEDRWWSSTPPDLRLHLRHLLARRLARANQVEQAAPYFPEDLHATYAAYVEDTRIGFDIGRPDPERAAAFWRAAQTLREHGMELLGTELEPDWAIWGGGFSMGPTTEHRRNFFAPTGSLFSPTTEELSRLAATPVPSKRYHYRYRAADLAWHAASLMPNDSEETARILDTAGRWVSLRDPLFANRFYQALVIRCGRTALGRAAAAKHWFPSAAPDVAPST